VTVQAVPEPVSCGVMVIGLGLLARRRRLSTLKVAG
jgi:hypothetical protein